MGSPDGDFENPVNIGTTSTTSLNITTEQINGALLNFGLIPGEESSVLFRIRATVAEPVDPLYSDPVELLFTPYEMEDRKSTRLNSSHVAISYAVFCLKKKS